MSLFNESSHSLRSLSVGVSLYIHDEYSSELIRNIKPDLQVRTYKTLASQVIKLTSHRNSIKITSNRSSSITDQLCFSSSLIVDDLGIKQILMEQTKSHISVMFVWII